MIISEDIASNNAVRHFFTFDEKNSKLMLAINKIWSFLTVLFIERKPFK